MDKPTYKITLDIASAVSPVMIDVMKDDDHRTLEVTLRNGSTPYELTSCGVNVNVALPDDTAYSEACTVQDNVITCPIDSNITAAEGIAECDFVITDSDQHQITTPKFFIRVTSGVASVSNS